MNIYKIFDIVFNIEVYTQKFFIIIIINKFLLFMNLLKFL